MHDKKLIFSRYYITTRVANVSTNVFHLFLFISLPPPPPKIKQTCTLMHTYIACFDRSESFLKRIQRLRYKFNNNHRQLLRVLKIRKQEWTLTVFNLTVQHPSRFPVIPNFPCIERGSFMRATFSRYRLQLDRSRQGTS